MFGFQKLDVYRCAVTFLGVASTLAERVSMLTRMACVRE
jgi:hypothetical protein